MTHLELENLASEYLEGLLQPARKAEVEAHLAECASCRELVAEVRGVMELCRTAEELEPAPWLVSKILLATVGARKPTLREQLVAMFRPAVQPRVAYAVAMAVFSFSIIINAAGINLRNFRVEDLNPRTWFKHATVAGAHFLSRAEKFCYDLRVVYEIETRFRRLGSQPQQQERQTPKQEPPAGGSSDTKQPGNPQLAANPDLYLAASSLAGTVQSPITINPEPLGAGRSRPQ